MINVITVYREIKTGAIIAMIGSYSGDYIEERVRQGIETQANSWQKTHTLISVSHTYIKG